MSDHPKPTESELEILQLLWENGSMTVRQVHDKLLAAQKVSGYTTSLKIMQIMFEKGLVSRERDGRSHIYTAVAEEKDTQRRLLSRFTDKVFKGSAMSLVMQALGNKKSSPEEIAEIRKMLDEIEKGKGGKQ